MSLTLLERVTSRTAGGEDKGRLVPSSDKDRAQSQHIQSGTVEQEHSEQQNDRVTRVQIDLNQGLKTREGERRDQGV